MSARRRWPLRLLPWVAMVVAAVVVVVSRTGVVSASSRSTATSTLVQASGGTVVVDLPALPTNLNPHTIAGDNAVTRAVGDLIWPQAYMVGPNLSSQAAGGMLTSAEVVSVDPQTVVYHIDPRARWSDGQPIRAADFEYLWHEETGATIAAATQATAPGTGSRTSGVAVAGRLSASGGRSSAGAVQAVSGGVAATGGTPSTRSTAAGGAVAAASGGVAASGAASGGVAASGLARPAAGVIGSPGYADIQSVTGSADGTTVTVVFKTAFADWAALFDNLVPEQVASADGWVAGFAAPASAAAVSGGPWKVQSWQPGQRLVLVHNPDWWGQAPKVDRLVLQVRSSPAAMVSDLAAGRAQLAQAAGLDLQALDASSSMPSVRSTVGLGTTMVQLVFDTTKAPLDQQPVRQAIAHLVDRTQLVDQLVQPLAPGVSALGSYLFVPGQSGYHRDGSAYAVAHPAEAARLLAGAGIAADGSGRLVRAGAPVPLTVTWASDNPWTALVGPAVAGQLSAAGFAVTSDPVPSATLTGTVLPGSGWDLAVLAVPGQAYTSQLVQAYGSVFGSYGADRVHDWSRFDSTAVDQLFHQAMSDLSATGSAAVYHQADQALWDAMPALPLFAEPPLVAWTSDLANVVVDDGGAGVLWNAQNIAYLVPGSSSGSASVPANATGAGR